MDKLEILESSSRVKAVNYFFKRHPKQTKFYLITEEPREIYVFYLKDGKWFVEYVDSCSPTEILALRL